jgi:hypothetical protein
VELDRYLHTYEPARSVQVVQVCRAAHPRCLRDMDSAVVDGGEWASITLPFPPRRVMCVLLRHSPAARIQAAPSYRLVFVAYHSDGLWHSGWVVHEWRGSLSTQACLDTLDTLGCTLDLGLVDPMSKRS